MSQRVQPPQPEEIEQLLRNAELWDEIEPFRDESLTVLDLDRLPTEVENDYLASMLDWERAPLLPIAEWFDPPLALPRLETLDEAELHELLWYAITRLFEKRIVLDNTDHLSDRQLYCVISRDILPALEKKMERRGDYLHWNCADEDGDMETWLRFYATPEEREYFAGEFSGPLPPAESPPHRRRMPHKAK
jgi:hypothetical protein